MILSQRPENANDCIGEWPTKKIICITILLMKIPSTMPTTTMGGGGNTRACDGENPRDYESLFIKMSFFNPSRSTATANTLPPSLMASLIHVTHTI